MSIAHKILLERLNEKIISFQLQNNHNQIRYTFRDGSILYITYNTFGEYAYQLIFTNESLDRIRFDSMDKNWPVDTNPHHFHPRTEKAGFSSPLSGKPESDMTILVKLIKSKKLRDPNFRFMD